MKNIIILIILVFTFSACKKTELKGHLEKLQGEWSWVKTDVSIPDTEYGYIDKIKKPETKQDSFTLNILHNGDYEIIWHNKTETGKIKTKEKIKDMITLIKFDKKGFEDSYMTKEIFNNVDYGDDYIDFVLDYTDTLMFLGWGAGPNSSTSSIYFVKKR